MIMGNSSEAHIGSTAVPEEVARFVAMADEWWDPNGKFKPLHKFNPVRIDFIKDRVCAHFGKDPQAPRPLSGVRILDIGCGGGLVSEPLALLGADMTSIDAAEKNVKIASLHAEQSGVKIGYRHILPEDLLKEGVQFDVVLNMEVVEHVADLSEFIDICCQMVKQGGAMVGATVSRTLKSLALAKIGAEYILKWLPPGTHDWNKFVKPSEFASELRRNDVIVKELAGMSFNPLCDKWSLSKDLDVNYLLFATKE